MVEKEIEIINPKGIHARPSALLVATVHKCSSSVTLIKGSSEANAGSIISILSLGAQYGERLIIRAEGPDEKEAIKKIVNVFTIIYKDDV